MLAQGLIRRLRTALSVESASEATNSDLSVECRYRSRRGMNL